MAPGPFLLAMRAAGLPCTRGGREGRGRARSRGQFNATFAPRRQAMMAAAARTKQPLTGGGVAAQSANTVDVVSSTFCYFQQT